MPAFFANKFVIYGLIALIAIAAFMGYRQSLISLGKRLEKERQKNVELKVRKKMADAPRVHDVDDLAERLRNEIY